MSRYRATGFQGKAPPTNKIVNLSEHSQIAAISDAPHWSRSNRGFNLHVSCSSLRRVPEMPHSIFAKFRPVSQRIVPDPAHRARRLRVGPVLFLPYAAHVQSVGFDGLEAVRNLRPGLSSRVWLAGGDMGHSPELAKSGKRRHISTPRQGNPDASSGATGRPRNHPRHIGIARPGHHPVGALNC
jgi:hypothetical protein